MPAYDNTSHTPTKLPKPTNAELAAMLRRVEAWVIISSSGHAPAASAVKDAQTDLDALRSLLSRI